MSGKTDVQFFCFMTFLKAIRLGEVLHAAIDWQSKHCNSYWLSLSCAEHHGRFVLDAVVISSNAIFNFMKEWASNPLYCPYILHSL